MRVWLVLARAARVLAGVLRGYRRIRGDFASLDAAAQAREVQLWAREMLRTIGIDLQIEGAPALGPVLLAANHISWLDILVMLAAGHCRFVAKSEIARWPLIGALTKASRALFIARASGRDALSVVHSMRDALLAGDVLAVFPEATTGDGRALLPFHGNLLQAAISASAPIQPVALRFVDALSGEQSFVPCYIGDDTLVGSVWRTLSAPPLRACVRFGLPEPHQGRSRRQWAEDLQVEIAALLH